MSVKAVVFDCYGVLYTGTPLVRNVALFAYVQTLQQRGYQVAVLSNSSQQAARRLFTQADYQLFSEIATSEAIGVGKPHPAAYQYVLDRLLVEPHEAVLVDDGADNIAGAAAYGMLAVQYRDVAATIARLEELCHA